MQLTNEQCFWLELVSKRGLGARILKELFFHFGSAEKISHATEEELEIFGASKRLKEVLQQTPELDVSRLEKICGEEDIHCVTLSDETYPVLLKEIPDPPPILFYRGDGEIFHGEKKFLSVVGSRKCTRYAPQVLDLLFRGLQGEKLCMVSGFAYGVDTLVHELAISYGFTTIAVLGSGIGDRCIYPAENRALLKKFFSGSGVIMSEFFPWQKALPQFFPQRNRIIAGLSPITLVIEASKKSGALLTANLARDYARDVAAIPGSIFSSFSEGTNALITEGASMVRKSEDLCEILQIERKNCEELPMREFNEQEKRIFSLLKNGEKHFDEIVRETQLNSQEVQTNLSFLLLDGIVKKIGPDLYGI